MIPTNRGPMTPDLIIETCEYISYATNRDRAPHLTPEQFKRCGFPNVERHEAMYQAELAIRKARASSGCQWPNCSCGKSDCCDGMQGLCE